MAFNLSVQASESISQSIQNEAEKRRVIQRKSHAKDEKTLHLHRYDKKTERYK